MYPYNNNENKVNSIRIYIHLNIFEGDSGVSYFTSLKLSKSGLDTIDNISDPGFLLSLSKESSKSELVSTFFKLKSSEELSSSLVFLSIENGD